jgi:hypothetical protein
MQQLPQHLPKIDAQKPYQKPRLRMYGDLGELTATAPSTNPHKDGGGGALSKTS